MLTALTIPPPLWNGSVTYFVLTVVAIVIGILGRLTGKVDKEHASIFILFAAMTGFCLWIFWYVMTFMDEILREYAAGHAAGCINGTC
ncbi:hypothetical protein AeMF1_010249 [Aphanomyces euteiches]|nr:hypothetical protein AeMF1_010249 [Aphanomyces euteiches]KAH9192595.1 hypothetical protein AeNC1_005426 [Aphanomyces euteiches]